MFKDKAVLVVVPARGGSKGVKLKNIQPVSGVPLVAFVGEVVRQLSDEGIEVSLFIDPEPVQVEASKKAGVNVVEFHTGRYAGEFNAGRDHEKELGNLRRMAKIALEQGLTVCAGHGLNYKNVTPVARIEGMHELNIGHSIISRAVFVGLPPQTAEGERP